MLVAVAVALLLPLTKFQTTSPLRCASLRPQNLQQGSKSVLQPGYCRLFTLAVTGAAPSFSSQKSWEGITYAS